MKPGWGAPDLPDLNRRTAVVTGASGGIGCETARQLAARSAHVVLACRDQDRAARPASLIEADPPDGVPETAEPDLASLEPVHASAGTLGERHDKLDILVNNAGIAGGPRRATADGFVAHFGVHHLGHFALTGLLLPALIRAGGRVVTMSSGLAAQARIDFYDLQSERRYRMTSAYGQSKLAGLLFALELDRRARSSTRPARAARTSLVSDQEGRVGPPSPRRGDPRQDRSAAVRAARVPSSPASPLPGHRPGRARRLPCRHQTPHQRGTRPRSKSPAWRA